ncbi:MAG: ABC transporter ATP-binding protein [Armatimonadota bacterium]
MKNILRFIKEVMPYRMTMIWVAILTLCAAAIGLPMPRIIGWLLDRLYSGKPFPLWWIFAAIMGISLLGSIVGYGLGVLVTTLGQRFMYDMREKLYSHMQTLSLGYFEKRQTGKLVSIIVNDVGTVNALLTGGFTTLISDVATLGATLFIVFKMNPWLALYALCVYPIYVTNYLTFIGRIKWNSRLVRDQRDTMLGNLYEKLAAVSVVKSYAQERYEVTQFVGTTRGLLKLNIRQGSLGTGLWVNAEFIGAIGTAVLLWFGGQMVMHLGGKEPSLTPGSLNAFIMYIGGYLYGPTLRLIQMNELLARTNAALERIFYMLDTKPDIDNAPKAMKLPEIQGGVRYEDVWFEYEPGQPVIKGINIDVKPGQMVALVGSSGSGKTTLVNLLQRHYDVTKGKITIDGMDIRDITLDSLKQQIGVVIQETTLFNDTLMENIRYGKLEATDEQVYDAAKAANIAHVIEVMPKGFLMKYGEDGVKLSGGERQRMAIARALLSDPRILILDEATSQLDSETETLIQQALERLMEGRTSFVIAHRLSTIVKADKIIVMGQGQIIEMGNHEELLALDGEYAALYNQQFKVALEGLESSD